MKNKLTTLTFALCLIGGALVSAHAQDATITYDHHGCMYGQQRSTFATISPIQLPANAKGTVEIFYELPKETDMYISTPQLLITDTLVVRDLDDYKGRVSYTVRSGSKDGRISVPAYALRGAQPKYLYVVADILPKNEVQPSAEAPLVPLLTMKISAIHFNGKPLEIKEEQVCNKRLYPQYQALFVPGDGGSRNYRIPAFVYTKKGTIVAMADRRKFNQVDLPEDIDIIMRRSTDNGHSWSEPEIIVEGHGRNKGFGDVALVETKSGKLVMIYVGGVGLWASTPDVPQRTYVSESTDDGKTWSAPRDITHHIFGKEADNETQAQWFSSFCASGQGILTPTGRIMFVAAIRENNKEYRLNNYAIYSDDEGQTWHISEKAFTRGDESKVIMLPDSNILMSVRNQGRQENGQRFFTVSKDNGQTWTRDTSFEGIHDPGCNGAALVVQPNCCKGKPGHPSFLIHSLPLGPNKRTDGVIYVYDFPTKKWSDPILINPGLSAYSDMLQLPNGNIAYFVEEDDQMSMVYIEVPLRYILSGVRMNCPPKAE